MSSYVFSFTSPSSIPSEFPKFPSFRPSISRNFPPFCKPSARSPRKLRFRSCSSKPSEAEELSSPEDEWLKKLPDKKKPLYSHSLPCIEAWLRSLGFYQSKEDRAVWLVEKPDWHAQLSLDVTDLYIRLLIAWFLVYEDSKVVTLEVELCLYRKSGPGNLEKDVERRFSYALSREDIENAVLGGP
ncbi:hypothetical protein TIFTF001_013685 [Ficus carica]|uniref:Uncharacterized protein n=1 Tax=Ficus carica TaxID=3494 RepID=A0AA87ZY66_FICCA|nr:hypothetical protein TIFTF001_013685 [Ficus carica]